MSNDELASNDELKEFKEEGEEDRLASEHLHSRLKNNLLDQVRFFHAFNLPFNVPSANHHGNSSHSASQSIYSSPFTDAHHPFFTHHHRAPPPAHMGRYFPLDLDTSAKSISPWALSTYPSLFHYHHTDSSSFQWHHPHPHHHSPTTTMYQSPFHFNLNFPPLSPHHPHPLSSPLPHSFFYSPTHATHLTSPSTSASPHSQPHQNPPTPSSQPSDTTQFTLLSPSQNSSSNSPSNVQNHVKKPLNAFMLFMKENRSEVAAESLRKESATINKILGEKWQSLSAEEQAVYYEKAKSQRELHRELYPCWTARDNYANNNKKKKKKREKSSENEGSLKKCRARFGLEHQASWCKPCRRKKKCIRFSSDKTDEC